ncbi:MAG: NUDIX hydrolase [Gammaproteobacteria bacterium]|nr:NUDIX hydrolase [Gammaproteobacteria bacterium]
MILAHITVAAVIEHEGRFLLVEEQGEGEDLVFNQPAGHVEAGENLLAAAVREVREETGHHFVPLGIVGMYLYTSPLNQVTYQRTCFYGTVAEPDAVLAHEAPEVRASHWLNQDDVRARRRAHRSPMVQRCIDDYLNGQRYSLQAVACLSPEAAGQPVV